MLIEKEVEAFRESGALPDNLSKRFLDLLTKDERKRVAAKLGRQVIRCRGTLPELATVFHRFARVQLMRQDKGETGGETVRGLLFPAGAQEGEDQ